ncbi:MAG: GtrA family protein [Rhodomicrobium sp.]
MFVRLSRYSVTGGIAAVVDTGVFSTLDRFGVITPVAASLSFCVAALVNYGLSARYAFGQKASGRGFRRFFLASLAGLAINVGVTVGLVVVVALPATLAKLSGIGVAFFVNFVINHLIVFRQGSDFAQPGHEALS